MPEHRLPGDRPTGRTTLRPAPCGARQPDLAKVLVDPAMREQDLPAPPPVTDLTEASVRSMYPPARFPLPTARAVIPSRIRVTPSPSRGAVSGQATPRPMGAVQRFLQPAVLAVTAEVGRARREPRGCHGARGNGIHSGSRCRVSCAGKGVPCLTVWSRPPPAPRRTAASIGRAFREQPHHVVMISPASGRGQHPRTSRQRR
jgi:hypothetical protein